MRECDYIGPNKRREHYAPPAAYYPGGGYEVTECMLAPAWERAFMDTARDILNRLGPDGEG